jgi:hypothetical protein
MSSNTATMTETISNTGLIIGLTVGGIIVLLMLIAFFVIRAKKGSSAAAPTTANGLGVLNKGPNAVPRTNVNLSSGNNGRAQ